MSRLTIPKTYKLYIGGAFPRSESGRSYEVVSAKGAFLANAAQASRKDARDAVVAARAAVSGWSGATAYNRGQVLYRVAEILDGRRAQFVEEIAASEGVSAAAAAAQVDETIDTWVWYAGWCDKFVQVAGSGNPVAGPYFNLSVPEPTGVVAIIAPQGVKGGSLLGLTRVIAPALVAGNTVVVVADQGRPLSAISLGEVLATSDVPGGVVNILTGSPAEIAPWLASHADVNALDLTGAEGLEWIDLEVSAADTLKRVTRPEPGVPERSLDRILTGSPAEIAPWLASHADVNALDLTGAEALEWIDLEVSAADTLKRVTRPEPGMPERSLDRILSAVETKTVWHTKALI